MVGSSSSSSSGWLIRPAGDGEPPLHAARQRLHRAVAALLQLGEGEEFVDPFVDDLARHAEVAAVDEQVLVDGQLVVEVVLLGHDPETRPDLGPFGGRVEAEHLQGAAGDRRDRTDHLHGRRLAGSVWSEEAEDFSLAHLEVDSVDSDEVAEGLGEAAGLYEW